MSVSLSIKNVPEALRQRPEANHRSLQRELDAIVAGSRWGTAPLLAREQANDRALTRTLDLDARADELALARQRAPRSAHVSAPYFLDTNILIYATSLSPDHAAHREAARAWLGLRD